MILGEVEYTVWRDEQGRVTTEDGPGAMPTEIPEQVRGGGRGALSGGIEPGRVAQAVVVALKPYAPPALPLHCPRMLRSGGTATCCGRTPPSASRPAHTR